MARPDPVAIVPPREVGSKALRCRGESPKTRDGHINR